ncbi:MAG: AsmA family protein, partial [Bacteroidetes bacterium]
MKKAIRITLACIVFLILVIAFLLLTPFIFREKLEEVVKSVANKSLLTELNFSDMHVSFIRHFPHLTITLSDFILKSSTPFSQDTLISAREVALGVNLFSLINEPIEITRIYIDRGQVNIQYDDRGDSNYDVYNPDTDTTAAADTSSGAAAIRIDHIIFSDLGFSYYDPTLPLKIVARGINYRGNTDIADAILKLKSRVQIDSLDLIYDQIPIIQSKPLSADLETLVDLNSLNMKLEKNDLKIKDIPFEFKGELGFRQDGYELFIAFFSMFGEEYLSGSLWLKSGDSLWLSAKTDLNITIENWIKGLAIKEVDLRGHFNMKLQAEGDLVSGEDSGSPGQKAMFLSIPDYTVTAHLENGYFRYYTLPFALQDISFDFSSSATRHDYKTITISLDNLNASFLENTFRGFFRVKNLDGFPVEAHLSTRMNLAELTQVIPFDSLSLKGMLNMNLDINGIYDSEKKEFPVTVMNLKIDSGAVGTKYYPQPVENIRVDATITNETGDLADTRIRLDPLSFTFEGNPFTFRGDFVNPVNLTYSIESKGSIDLAGIYHLFSQKGMDLSGYISTDLRLKGRQSDALAGNYDRLQNSGTLVLRDIAFTSEYLPLPLILKSGVFRFQDDRIWFEQFDSRYGSSDIMMNGHLSNVLNYLLTENQPLKGNFTFRSNLLVVDEFMAPDDPVAAETATDTIPEGVVVIPKNLEIGLNAEVKKIRFQNLGITDFTSDVQVKEGLLWLKSMQFGLAGCRVAMDAMYGSITPTRAFFDFHVTAMNFDVRRVYNEVELFRKLCSAAGKCEGIVSLDYTLKGRLGAGMDPIYPSLE